ncbi:hypothetical protein F5888DRAFT_388932 [Russula emetica]|nr:hypothetical protein F5888DRAFT_388932 [Russula emetica]
MESERAVPKINKATLSLLYNSSMHSVLSSTSSFTLLESPPNHTHRPRPSETLREHCLSQIDTQSLPTPRLYHSQIVALRYYFFNTIRRIGLAFAKRAIAHGELVVVTALQRSGLNVLHANPFIDHIRRGTSLFEIIQAQTKEAVSLWETNMKNAVDSRLTRPHNRGTRVCMVELQVPRGICKETEYGGNPGSDRFSRCGA